MNGDCDNGICTANVCASPTCSDAMKNGSETGRLRRSHVQQMPERVDLRGRRRLPERQLRGQPLRAPRADLQRRDEERRRDGHRLRRPDLPKCVNGKTCGAAADCQSNNCANGVCAAAGNCNDGMKNGSETDIDCGGAACPKCVNGKACAGSSDCQSGSCANGMCAAVGPTCTDGMKNGNETDVDCGGGTCTKCANGKTCSANTDCLSAGCVGGVCSVVAATCSDGLKNGNESDVDCGGPTCPKCPIGGACTGAADCTIVGGFAQCQNNICIVPNSPCNDKVKNGTETDIDCGGGNCGKCPNGWICNVGTDCKSGACSANICVPASPTCVDGIKNGSETDTDCGGAVCQKCAAGQSCGNSGDCSTGSCVNSVCGPVGAATVLWSKRFGNATDQECDVVRTDTAEDVYLANYITGLVDYGLGNVGGGEDISLVKLSAGGTTLWSKAYPDGTKQYPNGLGLDDTGKLFLAGGYYFTLKFGAPAAPITAAGNDDLFAAGFGTNGATLWAKSFGDASQFQQFNYMAIDPAGNPVMTGWLSGSANFGGGNLNGNNVDIVVVKLNKAGGHLWSHAYGNGNLQGGHGVAVDASGNVIVVGYSNGAVNFGGGAMGPAGSSIFLLKLDGNGNTLWVKHFASTQNELKPQRVAVDAAGNIYIGGGKRGNINFGGGTLNTTAGAGIYDLYLAKFDPSGNHVWSKNYGDGQNQWADDLRVDLDGNLIVTGSFIGSMNFGGGALNSMGGTEFGGDVFLAKISPAGNQLYAARFGDGSQQEPKSLTVDASGNVILCGLFQGSINFGNGALNSAGGNDMFVTKMSLP
ncbi:MAG: hypothetical protein U0359_11895 [Byssovorax sp.]